MSFPYEIKWFSRKDFEKQLRSLGSKNAANFFQAVEMLQKRGWEESKRTRDIYQPKGGERAWALKIKRKPLLRASFFCAHCDGRKPALVFVEIRTRAWLTDIAPRWNAFSRKADEAYQLWIETNCKEEDQP